MCFIRRRRNFLKRGRSRESIDAGQLREFCSAAFSLEMVHSLSTVHRSIPIALGEA